MSEKKPTTSWLELVMLAIMMTAMVACATFMGLMYFKHLLIETGPGSKFARTARAIPLAMDPENDPFEKLGDAPRWDVNVQIRTIWHYSSKGKQEEQKSEYGLVVLVGLDNISMTYLIPLKDLNDPLVDEVKETVRKGLKGDSPEHATLLGELLYRWSNEVANLVPDDVVIKRLRKYEDIGKIDNVGKGFLKGVKGKKEGNV